MFVTNAKLSLIVLSTIPLVVVPIILFGRRVRRLSRSSQDTLADVGSYAGESLRQIKLVQAFNHQQADVRAFDERVEDAFAVAVRRIRNRAILIGIVMLLVFGGVVAMLWSGGQAVLGGDTTAGELAAFGFYAFIVAGSVGAISEVLSDLQRAAGAMERLMELLASTSVLKQEEHPQTLAATEPAGLTLDNVHFAYPTRPEVKVLNGVSLTIEPGEMIALVGPSGAGKSTLFDLLLRFYDPTQGTIRLDGVDLRQLSLHNARGAIALVPQEATLMAGTIRDVVAYGAGIEPVDDAQVTKALEQANAAGFVAQLPDGLATRLGEGGVGLSGGQRQRLAIARALYCDPRVLLLDEATSALDAESEDRIRDTLMRVHGRCTVLAIAHRLSTVVGADRIVVLDEGAVAAVGTHTELLSTSPLYARYAQMQLTGDADTATVSLAGS